MDWMSLLSGVSGSSGESKDTNFKGDKENNNSSFGTQMLNNLMPTMFKNKDSGFYGHGHPADHKTSIVVKGSPDCKQSSKCRAMSKYDKM